MYVPSIKGRVPVTFMVCLWAAAVMVAALEAPHLQNIFEHHDLHDHHEHHEHHDDDDSILVAKPTISHQCVHDSMPKAEVVTVPQSYLHRPPWMHDDAAAHPVHRPRAELSTYTNMRFKVYFDVDNQGTCTTVGQSVPNYRTNTQSTCADDDILTDLKRDYIVNTLMPAAANFLNGALNVIAINGSLVAPGTCYGVTTPASHQSPGVSDADFVAYVTAVPLEAASASSGTVAWATSCANDQIGRPIVGHVNFVPNKLTNAVALTPYKTAQDINTAIHELSHALGFSSSYFGPYVDMSNVRQNSGGLVTQNSATLGKDVSKLVTPRLLAAAKTYFGCTTMDGVEIEDQGGSGTAGSHWEKRILYTEYITGILSSVKTYISTLTLAFFEDTGFYTANYGWAQDDQMAFGKGRGCDFLNTKCNTIGSRLGEFCFDRTTSNQYCSPDFLGMGYCGIAEYSSSLPSYFQYFSGPAVGGVVSLSDYCPTGVYYSNRVCVDGSTRDSQDIYGNTFGSASKCFQSSIIAQGYNAGDASVQTRCFAVRCSTAGRIEINVRGSTAYCPTDGSEGNADTSAVGGYSGVIKCPKSTAFCRDPSIVTPAPAPPAPTPIPTPAPPGQTPAPGPTTRPPESAPTALPANCADRVACANALTTRLPWCAAFASALIDCFGTTCDSTLASWLSTNSASCTSAYQWGINNCVDGATGGKAMCALLNI